MQATQLIKYHSQKPVIQINNIDPAPLGPHDVLIQTSVAAVNPLDNLIVHGELKLVTPYQLPHTIGNEFVGTVKEVGAQVTSFQAGDRVFARNPINQIGAFAEQIVVNADALALVPEYLSDEEAAAMPLTALTAMQALDILHAQPGQTIFISGGTGSFGAMAIPIAIAQGLTVITSGNGRERERMLQLGVTQFIDYRKEDYSQSLHNVDLVIDTIGGSELKKEFTILKPGGHLVSLRAMPNRAFAKRMQMGIGKQLLFQLAAHSIEKRAAQKQQSYDFMFVTANGQQLAQAAAILADQQVHPQVGHLYSLAEINQALADVANHRSPGKVLIKF